jgi:putative addiction module killer protein
MIDVRKTDAFEQWLSSLRDVRAQARIVSRIDRVAFGLMGDTKPVGDGVREMRVDYGPGYRVYFVQRGKTIIILLCGGDKRTQDKDIKIAKAMAADL